MVEKKEVGRDSGTAEEKQSELRPTLTERAFGAIGRRMEKTDRGKAIVDHVRERTNFYSQTWSLSLTVALVILLRCTVVTAFYIPSPSMLDTLLINDRVFVFRLAYLFAEPEVGDIVVFKVPETIPQYDPEKPIWIKRIVGVEGDTVSIDGGPRGGRLLIDGEAVSDPPFFKRNRYIPRTAFNGVFEPTKVPEDHVMVFGDNSTNSYDGRTWGPLPKDRIIGKAFVRFWPLHRMGPLHGESHNRLPPGSLPTGAGAAPEGASKPVPTPR